MKGFVKVSKSRALAACAEWEVRTERAKDTLRKGVNLYYFHNYQNGGWFHKWRHKGKTPREYYNSTSVSWDYHSDILSDLLTTDELKLIHDWETDYSYSTRKALLALANSAGLFINVGEDLAEFMVKYSPAEVEDW